MKNCIICGKQFEPKVHNRQYCYEPHLVKCRICDNIIDITKNETARVSYLKKGFVYCSQRCSCKGIGIDKVNEANKNVDLDKLKLLIETTCLNNEQIADILNTSVDFVSDRITRLNFKRPEHLKEQAKQIHNENIKQAKFEKFKDESYKREVLTKVSNTYKARTGFDHNFKNPQEVKRYVKIKRDKHNGNYFSENTLNSIVVKRYEKYDKDDLVKRAIQTKIKKYGSVSMKVYNFPENIKNILYNKDNFITFIQTLDNEDKTRYKIAEKLNVSYSFICDLIQKYNISYLLPYLANKSYLEQEVLQFLKTITNVEILNNTREIIHPYELDLYLPEYKVAIECNGSYWHSSKYLDKNYHYNKSKICEEKGIRLIHIFEYEWNNDRQQSILKNIIKNALNINENKIYARKCNIKIINKTAELREFFDKNNIQGFRPGKFSICLEYNNEIIMSYIFGHCFFGKGKYECEVIRGATKLGYTVVGGASKIWKYFIYNYNYNNCVYYVDYNYFNGNSLPYLNLKYITTNPSYKNFWVNDCKVTNRDPINHNKIKQAYANGECYPIYNAGSKVYVWNR